MASIPLTIYRKKEWFNHIDCSRTSSHTIAPVVWPRGKGKNVMAAKSNLAELKATNARSGLRLSSSNGLS